MSRIGIIDLDYEGNPLATLVLPGNRFGWPIHHIGRALGHGAKGRGLLPKVRNDWVGDFIEGCEYLVLSDEDMEAVRAGQDPARPVVAADASRLTVLLGDGLKEVMQRSEIAEVRALRSFLERQFAGTAGLPSLDLGKYESFLSRAMKGPDRAKPESRLSRALRGPDRGEHKSALSLAVEKVQRLSVNARRSAAAFRERRRMRVVKNHSAQIQLEDRRFQVGMIHRLIDFMAGEFLLDAETRLALELEACSVATNDRVVLLGARDRHLVPEGTLDVPTGGHTREKLQLDAMLRGDECPLVLAWEPDGRLGAFRYFPDLRDPVDSPSPELPEAV